MEPTRSGVVAVNTWQESGDGSYALFASGVAGARSSPNNARTTLTQRGNQPPSAFVAGEVAIALELENSKQIDMGRTMIMNYGGVN